MEDDEQPLTERLARVRAYLSERKQLYGPTSRIHTRLDRYIRTVEAAIDALKAHAE